MKRCLPIVLCLLLPNTAFAGFYYEFGFLNGGDRLVTGNAPANIFPGEDAVKAGSGRKLAFGWHELFGKRRTHFFSASVGFLEDDIDSTEGDASLETTSIDAIYGYRLNPHRLGFGLSFHQSPDFKQDIDSTTESKISFENAAGFLLQYSYEYTPAFHIGVRYIDMEYEANDLEIDASGVGLLMMLTSF
jgi:hypothetical protein